MELQVSSRRDLDVVCELGGDYSGGGNCSSDGLDPVYEIWSLVPNSFVEVSVA
jgi:hypothetical protein